MTVSRIYEMAGALVPVNSTAGRVSSPGVQYEPNKRITQRHWDAPPALKPVLPNMRDLTGFKFGRFTVMGLLKEVKGLWLVRCVCGAYESRHARSIKNLKNKEDCCDHCRHVNFLRSRG